MLMLPLLVAASVASPAPPTSTPAPGRYDARLCVTVNTQAPSCGPVQAQLGRDGSLSVRIDDIRYQLSFEQGLAVVLTMHGNMLVSEFLSSYRWAGSTLLFGDRARGAQYELDLAPPAATPASAPAR
ncbi:MAG: hypothetical protein ABW190_08290 [Rhizobacter sp.]